MTNAAVHDRGSSLKKLAQPRSAAAFLTQLQVLSGREWKILRRSVGVYSFAFALVVLADCRASQ